MNFLVDNQLPPALAQFIRTDLGAQAVHVSEIKLDRASDRQIWQYASEHDLIVISKDEDFVTLNFGAPLVTCPPNSHAANYKMTHVS